MKLRESWMLKAGLDDVDQKMYLHVFSLTDDLYLNTFIFR